MDANGDSQIMRNGHVAVILCEGVCSNAYDDEDVLRLRAAGYREDEIREEMTGKMQYTSHTFDAQRAREGTPGTYDLMYACLVCGHQRVFGCVEY